MLYAQSETVDAPDARVDAWVVACPSCDAPLKFCRDGMPRIDACGFESYSFECKECGAALAGIVDPFDDTLLLSEIPA